MSISNYTFWKLLNDQGVEIPSIQRDYAQGRNYGKIPIIRKKFLEAIFSALDDKEKLGLDFVYGKIFGLRNEEEYKRNKKAIESLLHSIKTYANSIDLTIGETSVAEKDFEDQKLIYLIPLDGQQRLTTLFLVHWYLAKRLGKVSDLAILKNFKYKTRKSSESFINLLCSADKLEFGINLKEEIINLEGFSNTWENDPTVNSMLNVIGEIHEIFVSNYSEEQLLSFYNGLTADDLIYFDFLDLKDFNLSDDLYVKMNARGKQLSDFENFKAWLFNKIEQENLITDQSLTDYSLNFDISWNDIFWNAKSKNVYEIDDSYFEYFKLSFLSHFINDYVAKENSIIPIKAEEFYLNSEVVDILVKKSIDFDFEKFFDNNIFKKNLKTYFRFLELCKVETTGESNMEILDSALQEFFSFYLENDTCKTFSQFYFSENIMNTNWWQKLYFFAIQRYILKVDKYLIHYSQEDLNHLSDYNRIISNLIFNTYVDSPDDFKNYLYSIEVLLDSLDLSKSLIFQNDLIGDTSFRKIQKDEEITKCELLQNIKEVDTDWRTAIVSAEKHPYFYGQINFILKVSEKVIDAFITVFEKLDPLFEREILNHKSFILQRSLLTKGNYFVSKSNNKESFIKNTFGTVRDRDENWRQVFNNANKVQILKSLIFDVDYDKENVEDSLDRIIQKYVASNLIDEINFEKLHYKELYIRCPQIFTYGRENLIQLFDGHYAYQLNSSSTIGYFNELITFYIKNLYFDDLDIVKYRFEIGWNHNPGLDIENFKVNLIPSENVINVTDGSLDNYDVYQNLKGVVEKIESLVSNI
ncbi:DUF262 domain-containing protein [Epilithonimonas sp. JDS]|uniref:GmrSD restriction endonuclease domain-containing protein n=1 Tax=Epilithonimonas sp. JDS TaxID=2902797 RepID=UPI001E540E61|nr:DUF262 domain-containing protein [Epilithonimonas sp. JDS]MCD9854515.1 DUF262 domain-containing protein [Epilithonimonas sp. JDS]